MTLPFETTTEAALVWDAYTHALSTGLKVLKSKTANTGSYSYQYANLGDVMDAVRQALAEKGAVLSQIPSGSADGTTWTLHTVITHLESGEYICFAPYTRPQVRDEQGFGGALSYGRRYALTAIFGIDTTDDDGKDVTDQQRNTQKYDGSRSAQELAVRTLMSEYPDRRAEFAEAFKTRFGKTLADLNVNKHAEALVWTAEWFNLPAEAPDPEPTQEELS